MQALIVFFRSGFFILGAVGYIILIVSRSGALSYVGVYLAAWCVKMIDSWALVTDSLTSAGSIPIFVRDFFS